MYIFTPQITSNCLYFYLPIAQHHPQPFIFSPLVQQSPVSAPSIPNNENLQKIIVTRQDLLKEGYESTKRAWTEEEDKILLRLCSKQRACYDQIALKLEGRNGKMCYSRYRRLCNQSKDCWTKAQNDKLCRLVQQYGLNEWKSFVSYFPNRNHKQLKDHYDNYLRPNLANYQWTLQQDLELIQMINHYGKNWRIIQSKMSHRSRNQIKNRYFGRILRLNNRKLSQMLKRSGSEISQTNQFDQ